MVQVISLGFRTDLALRALEGSEITDHGEYLSVRTPANPGFWWGNYLLLPAQAAGADAERWLALFAAEFPAARHVALGLDVTSDAGADLAGFAAAGLDVRRDTVLTAASLREPPHANRAAVCRPLAGESDWQQAARLQAVCDAANGGPDNPAFTAARMRARRQLTEAGHGSWFGAFLDGELLCQLGVFGGAEPVARYQDVATHPQARRRGLAGTLAWQAGRYAASKLNARTLVIVADPAEAAIRLYRSIGFRDRQTAISLERPA